MTTECRKQKGEPTSLRERCGIAAWPAAGFVVPLVVLATACSGQVLRVEPISSKLLYEPGAAPLSLLLSKSRYPAEDGHLDAIVWLKPAEGRNLAGELRVEIRDAKGAVMTRDSIQPIPAAQIFFHAVLPAALAGRNGRLNLVWVVQGRTVAEAAQDLEVLPPTGASTSGRVRLTVPNALGVTLGAAPMTCGVPFPRGALDDEKHVRLLDEKGAAVPIQTEVLSRWSRFGSIRWLLCSFTVDLAGKPRELALEFAPGISRRAAPGIEMRDGGHTLLAGRLRVDDGIWFDANGDGEFGPQENFLSSLLESGPFVAHENGKRYLAANSPDLQVSLEESGPEKTVVRRRGWYALKTGEKFCRFDTRIILHRGCPLVRMLHTWTFTGDSNADRIRDMGITFETKNLYPLGFLRSFDAPADWIKGRYLLQFDHDKSEVVKVNGEKVSGARAPGMFAAEGNGARLFIGVRDFWQDFPQEIEFDDRAMIVHTWPRHGKPHTHATKHEDAFRLWFAHEGQLLDFRLPKEFGEDPIHQDATASGERHWRKGHPETVNAQGISKTTELWLLFSADKTPAKEIARIFRGLNDETIRAVVDPKWVCESGAFHEAHWRDVANYPDDERIYEAQALAPIRWAERLRVYGKWAWGDVLAFPRLGSRTARLYRCFRKAHQGWPYSWLPFARSGDPRLFRFAQASTRHMTDVCFCHYSDERVKRELGWWNRSLVPWTFLLRSPTARGYCDEVDYLWHSYYLTGYRRAAEIAKQWGELTKVCTTGTYGAPAKTPFGSARQRVTLLKSYTEMYQATFDPWFLAAAHQFAKKNRELYAEGKGTAHFWNAGDREFHRFTGSDEHARYYLDYARLWGHQRDKFTTRGWANYCPMIESVAYAYLLTGEDLFLRRVANGVDWARAATYEGEPEYLRGSYICRGGSEDEEAYTGYYLRMLPFALTVFEQAGRRPAPVASAFFQLPASREAADNGFHVYRLPTIVLQKKAGEKVPLALRLGGYGCAKDQGKKWRYRIVGPDGKTIVQGEYERAVGEQVVEIPAQAPSGVYQFTIEGESASSRGHTRPALYMPLSEHGVPEVMVLGDDAMVGPGYWKSQYWFRVPEGIDEFWMEVFPDTGYYSFGPLSRVTLWDPRGQVAHREEFPRGKVNKFRMDVIVPKGQGDRLWRLSLPGGHAGFRLDPRVPHVFAASPDRFFMPESR